MITRPAYLNSISFNNLVLELTNTQFKEDSDNSVAYISNYASYQSMYSKPHTAQDLSNIYSRNFIEAARDPNIKFIHTKLMGIGAPQFSPQTTFYALFDAFLKFNRTSENEQIRNSSGQVVKIKLFIKDHTIYESIKREMYILQNLHDKFGFSLSETFELAKCYTVTPPDFARKKTFTLGYVGDFIRSDNPISKITDQLYLSRIPLKDEAETFYGSHPNLGAVVSVIEDFELADKSFFPLNIQSPKDWKALGVSHFQIPVKDNTQHEIDFPLLLLANVLENMHVLIESGKDILVHCRAGKSRSATVVMAYLKLYGNKENGITPNSSSDEIYDFLKTKRKQISLNAAHFKVIDDLLKAIALKKDSMKPVTGDSETKFVINMVDESLKLFSSKQAIIQCNSIKNLKKLALEQSQLLPVINNFLAELCLVGNVYELKKLINHRDKLSPYKIQIYNDIITMAGTIVGLPPSALTTLTQLRKNDPKINPSLEPNCKRNSVEKHYTKTLLTFTDPDRGLMLLVENKSLERKSIRLFNSSSANNTIKTPCGVVSPETAISFNALKELVDTLGLNFKRVLNNCPDASFYFLSTSNKGNVAFHTYCLDLGVVDSAKVNVTLEMTNLSLNRRASMTDFSFINVKDQLNNPNSLYCFGNMRTTKKLDTDEFANLQKMLEANDKFTMKSTNWQSHIEHVRGSLTFYMPDSIPTPAFGDLHLQEFLEIYGEANYTNPYIKMSLQEALNILSPNGELLKQEETPIYTLNKSMKK